jgi:ectoine hydroxylase-related dioxygenase (phytanoyl-CoA dioxygenase family)
MSIKKVFDKKGFVVVPKVLKKDQIDQIKDIAHKIFQKFSKKKSWDDLLFHQDIAKLRRKNPEKFSFLYNTLQSNIRLKSIAQNDLIINNIKKILKINEYNISHSICHMRIDSFFDEKNSYDWHQERSYYPMNERGNGIVVWIALTDIDESIGPLHALQESHHEGFRDSKKNKKIKNYSTQYLIKESLLNKYKNKVVKFCINEGDAIFMNMNTFHKSGKNYSNRFRLSIVSRYHDNSKNDFRAFYDMGNYLYSKIKKSDL